MPGQKAGTPSHNSPQARLRTAQDHLWIDVLLIADEQRADEQRALLESIVRLARRCKALLEQINRGGSGYGPLGSAAAA